MSNYSTVFDGVISRLASLYPSKTIIPNPYSLEDNQHTFLRDSYGLRLGPSETFTRSMNHYTFNVSYNFVYAREHIYLTNDETSFNDTVKLLIEDYRALHKDICAQEMLVGDYVDKIEFTGLSDPQFIRLEEFNLMALTASFNFVISDLIA